MIVEFNYRSFQKSPEHIEFSAFRDCPKVLMRSVNENNAVHDFTAYNVDPELIIQLFDILDDAQEKGEFDHDVLDGKSDKPVTEIELTFDEGNRFSYFCNGFDIPRRAEIVAIIREVFKVPDDEKLYSIFN